ncbi:MAG: nuclear transport factor 2 family protein [Gemmatimonadota bacterium]|nr:nuclear transport factor 2 family protein [Gemmatimonadota bacterium]
MKMKKIRLALALTAAFALVPSLLGCRIERAEPALADTADEPDLAARVADMLDGQAAAWNGGDLESFMAAYERSPETTYIGSGGLIEGFDGIRERYAPLFQADAERDSLRFTGLRVRQLDPRFGVATARYVLYRDGEVTSTGPFTLVLLRVEDAWRIVHDQSAEDPPDGGEADPQGGP